MIVDLHGLTENEATPKILLRLHEFKSCLISQLTFITGRGEVLSILVKNLTKSKGLDYQVPKNNPGIIEILK